MLIVIGLIFVVVSAVFSIIAAAHAAKDDKARSRNWTIAGILVGVALAGIGAYQQRQSSQEQTKQQDKLRQDLLDQQEAMAEKAAIKALEGIIVANKTNNREQLKATGDVLADQIKSNPESVKTITDAAKKEPAGIKSVVKAVATSPKLEEAIRHTDPTSTLLPENRTISKGTLVKKGANGICLFDFSTAPNSSFSLRMETGNTPGTGYTYSIGQPIPAEARIMGIFGVTSATINGRKYEHLYIEGYLEFTATPLIVPDSTTFPVTITGRFTFEGTLAGYINSPMINDPHQPNEPVFNYRLHGKGVVTIEFHRKYESSLEFSRVTYRFQ